jgi:simple sugar transport system ATP-binding protein
MVGHAPPSVARPAPRDARQPARLSIRALRVARAAGGPPVAIDALDVHAGEIVGVAGVSGNGQRELVEALCGQRSVDQGAIDVDARPWRADRASMRAARFGCVPESPLANATAPDMALADNLVLRVFDRAPIASRTGRVRRDALRASAQALAARFAVQSGALGRAIATLSGGNVQRAVLGRELVDDTRLLVAVNPAFGLDVGAAADVRRRLVELRATGCAVLLVSEDLDELITLSDRIVVMFEGRVVLSTLGVEADRQALGLAMAGHSAIASARADN